MSKIKPQLFKHLPANPVLGERDGTVIAPTLRQVGSVEPKML
jgi:hypothetical protein